jgi:toxin ParE1/3/4
MKIEWSPLSIQRINEISDYIAEDNIDAAIKWIKSIIDSVDKLDDFPEQGRKVPEANRQDIREIIIKNYRIIYRFQKNKISILSIRHGRQILPDSDIK